MQNDDFYVHLPSDGDQNGLFPENNRGEYTIPLGKAIDCTDIKKIWEVAITDVTIPTCVYNIGRDMDRRICLGSFKPNKPHNAGLYGEFIFPPGQYTPHKFVETFNFFTSYLNMWPVKTGKWGNDTKKKEVHTAKSFTPLLPYDPTASYAEIRSSYYKRPGAPPRSIVSPPTKRRKTVTEGKEKVSDDDDDDDDDDEDEEDEVLADRHKKALTDNENIKVEEPMVVLDHQTLSVDDDDDDDNNDGDMTFRALKSNKDIKKDVYGFAHYIQQSNLKPPEIISNRLISDNIRPTTGFGISADYDEDKKKIKFKFTAPNNPWIWIPGKALRFLLGFSDKVEGERIICPKPITHDTLTSVYLSDVCNLNFYIEDMFIYTDIVQWTRVGSVLAPLLDVVNVSEAVQASQDMDSKQFQISHPKYIELVHQCINNISIKILDSAGNHFGFDHGRVRVSLHFTSKKRRFI